LARRGHAARLSSTAAKKPSVPCRPGDKAMKVEGNLTFHGVTKPASFVIEKTGSVNDPKFGKKHGFHGTLTLKRSEYGVTYMPGGLGEDVEITVSLEGNEG
jgi:polyisoprenoid-binding protein YceI